MPTTIVYLFELDGYEFLTSDDNAAEADFDADYDDTTGAGYCTLNSVEFNGVDFNGGHGVVVRAGTEEEAVILAKAQRIKSGLEWKHVQGTRRSASPARPRRRRSSLA